MGFLRAVLGALKNALLAAFEWGWWLITLPVRALMPGPGPGRSAVAPPPDVAERIRETIARADDLEARAPSGPSAEVKRVLEWAASTSAGRYVEAERISATLPPQLCRWTMNLTDGQARALLNAEPGAVSRHISGTDSLEGVRSVRGFAAVRAVRTAAGPTAEPTAACGSGSLLFRFAP